MGTWGPGPFDNDAAADFLEAARASPSPARFVAKVLRGIAKAPVGQYIDVDDGGAAWAASELVALAWGRGNPSTKVGRVLDIAEKLAPSEELRRLALDALPRIADRATSELAGLWHEGRDGEQFDAALAQLRERLEATSER